MINFLKRQKDNIFIYVSFILYATVSLISVIFHESWADEAQAWLIARDLNIFGIINQMKYEGHSCMWHLILAPFAKLGFPYETTKIISWLFCLATVYLILKKAPFNKIIKLLIIFNPSLTYAFPAISRPYCMIPLFIVCLCVLYKNKEKHQRLYALFLALLANTHIIMLPMVGMLILDFWGEKLFIKRKAISKEEKKKLYKSLIIAILGILIFLVQIMFSLFECKLVTTNSMFYNLSDIKTSMNAIKYTFIHLALLLTNNSTISYILLAISGILIVISSFFNRRQALLFWPQVIFFILLHSFIWFLILQRVYALIYILMFWVWNNKYNDEEKNNHKKISKALSKYLISIAFILVLITSIMNYRVYINDIKMKYSSAKDVANFIQENLPEDSVFICATDEVVSSVIPYVDKDKYHFYSAVRKQYYTFVTWDEEWGKGIKIKDVRETIEYFKNLKKDNVYLLCGKNLAYVLKFDYFEKIFETNNNVILDFYTVDNEEYELYKVE